MSNNDTNELIRLRNNSIFGNYIEESDSHLNELKIPLYYHTYKCYDSCVMSDSHQYNVTILKIVSFDKASEEVKKHWELAKKRNPLLFNDTTDYFVYGLSDELGMDDIKLVCFARQSDGVSWYGMGIYDKNTNTIDDMFCSGVISLEEEINNNI